MRFFCIKHLHFTLTSSQTIVIIVTRWFGLQALAPLHSQPCPSSSSHRFSPTSFAAGPVGGCGSNSGGALQLSYGVSGVAPPTPIRTNPADQRHPPFAPPQPAAHGADLWAWEAGPGPGPPDPFHDDWKHWRDRGGGRGGGGGDADADDMGGCDRSLEGGGRGGGGASGNGGL